jgi:hypothetical protein
MPMGPGGSLRLFTDPAVDQTIRERTPRGLADGSGQRHRRTAGRILLEAVMLLDDLDIVRLTEHGGHLANHMEQDIHPDAHVGPVDDRDMLGRPAKLGLVVRRQAGGAHDQADLAVDTDIDTMFDGIGQGKVDHHIGGVGMAVFQNDIQLANTGDQAGILAQIGVIGPLQGGHDGKFPAFDGQSQDAFAHPPGGPADN